MIIERERNIYNKNSYNNYMRIEKYSYRNDFSEKEFSMMIHIRKVKSIKNRLDRLNNDYKKEKNLFNSIQLDLLKSKNDSEFIKISEHLNTIKLYLRKIEREIKITEKEYYEATHR
jgi:hypothetical protein